MSASSGTKDHLSLRRPVFFEARTIRWPRTTLFQHPNQGYHVKLTVHADGSAGADTKYKTFWIPSCALPS